MGKPGVSTRKMCNSTKSQVIANGLAAHPWRFLLLISAKTNRPEITLILKCSMKVRFSKVGCVTPWVKCFRSCWVTPWWATNGTNLTSRSFSLINTLSSVQKYTWGLWRHSELFPSTIRRTFIIFSSRPLCNYRSSYVLLLPEYYIKSCRKVIGSRQLNWT